MRLSEVFKSGVFSILVAPVLLLFVLSCTPEGELQTTSQHCGSGGASSRMNGLFWLLGEPSSANVLCSVQNSEFKQVYVLEPDSRDPLLFEDQLTGRVLLVERFSGGQARPSRATWYTPEGVQLAQSGDWPQNTYSALRLSEEEGLATGFDFGQLRYFLMATTAEATLGQFTEKEASFSNFNPIVTLQSGAWLALISSGFDLTSFSAKDAQVMRVSDGGPHSDGLVPVVDSTSFERCKNAFQTLQLSNSHVILSCNPQYFGPEANELVAVFEVELKSDGELSMRKLHSENGAVVQRIDLLGQPNLKQVSIGMKVTSADDYTGRFVRSAHLSLDDLQLQDFDDARGPTTKTKLGERVVFCTESSRLCKSNEFLVNDDDEAVSLSVNPQFSLPFLSFTTKITAP